MTATKTMTVAELIEWLQSFKAETPVYCEGPDGAAELTLSLEQGVGVVIRAE
jgi:hypothetical protein